MKDYIILIAPAEPRSFLAQESDEACADSAVPCRTLDLGMARRFDNFNAARAVLHHQIKKYPQHQFKLDVTDKVQPI